MLLDLLKLKESAFREEQIDKPKMPNPVPSIFSIDSEQFAGWAWVSRS